MPVALDPENYIDFVLESDKSKPEGKRPTFVLKVLTGRDWQKLVSLSDQAAGGADSIRLVYDSVKIALVGWRNMFDPATGKDIPHNQDELDNIITPAEANELLDVIMGQRLNAGDKKKLKLPLVSGTGKSARNVRAGKSARTRRKKGRKS